MIIPIELRFEADKDSKSTFRTDKLIKSHDVNSVEFHISIDGLELTDNHTAKILSVFNSSKSQVNVDCEILEGKIIYKPDTNLISRFEHVTSYVYVYNGNQSLDVREFTYIVDLSKIDETSLKVKEVYDQSYADLLADFEQALNDYKESLPQADSVRSDIDEILNQFSEDSQAKLLQYDTDAQQVIADNQTAFDLAESVRQDEFDTSQIERHQQFDDAQSARQESYEQTQSLINEAEESREQAEGQRESAESSRVSAESDRVSSEADRALAENERQTNETERQTTFETNESERDGTFSTNEDIRQTVFGDNEANRIEMFNTNETARQENEITRQEAETQRASAESSRVSAEEQRKTDHANRSAELAGKADKVVLKNEVVNGNFSAPDISHVTSTTLDLEVADGRLKASKSNWTYASGSTIIIPNGYSSWDEGDLYYIKGSLKVIGDTQYDLHFGAYTQAQGVTVNVNNYRELNDVSRVYSPSSKNFVIRHFLKSAEYVEIILDNVITINLTKTFGAGNEPTKEEMDELIKVTGYIDGEYALNNKEMLTWTLALIRHNKNAIVTLGGA